jgi:hypothetical protein
MVNGQMEDAAIVAEMWLTSKSLLQVSDKGNDCEVCLATAE